MITFCRKLLGASALILLLAGAAAPAGQGDNGKKFPAEAVRAELDELYEEMQAAHFDLYARRSKREYDALYRNERRAIGRPMSLFEVQVLLQKFLAYGRIAHAHIDLPMPEFSAYRASGGKAFPVYLRVVDGRALISENDSGLDTIAVGDELLAVDGQAVSGFLQRLSAHVSADNDYLAYTQMEPLMPAYVWLEKGSVVGFDLSVRHRGEVRRVHVPALSRAQMQAAATAQPPSLALDWNRREAHVGDGGIAYLRPGPFYNNDEGAGDPYDTRAFKTFIDAAFEDFRRAGCRALLIDLRDNPGGDNSFSDLMVGWFADRRYRFASVFQIKTSRAAIDNNQKRLTSAVAIEASVSKQFAAAYAQHRPGEVFDFDIPLATPRRAERFRGKVFLLINRHTYSNAVSVAALAQDYHFATILGEETADLASTYGAMEQFTLSRTGIVVNFPKARIIRPNGNTAARGVVPDIAIRTPINEGRQDAVLAQALTIAAAKTGGKTASTSTHGEMRPGRWRLRMRTDVAGLPFSPPAVTSSHCLRAQQVKYGAANALQEQWSNCRYANRRRSGDRVSYELRCPRTDSAQGNYQFSSDGDHVHGTAVIGSGASRITLAWSGERLGSCAME